jgi:hypothetical protein
MRFPKVIKHRRFEATIYGKSENYDYYRVAYYTAGKRHILNFKKFSEANKKAKRIVRDLSNGSQSEPIDYPSDAAYSLLWGMTMDTFQSR